MYRSTTLKTSENNCPAAVDYYEAGVPYDRTIFQTGVAAHAILEAIGLSTQRVGRVLTYEEAVEIARNATVSLQSTGRSFEGVPEPPLPHREVEEALGLVKDWLAGNALGTGHTFTHYEIGIAVSDTPPDRPWTICDYSGGNVRLRAAIDRVWDEELLGEDEVLNVVVVDDYKTNWHDRTDALDSLQRKIQVILVHDWCLANEIPVDVIRRQVTNLRTQWTYKAEMHLYDQQDADLLSEWRDAVSRRLRAEDAMPRPRPHRPSHRCGGCPWLSHCEPARELLGPFLSTPEAIARALGVSDAVRSMAVTAAKAAFSEAGGPIETEAGTIGHQRVTKSIPATNAASNLLEMWTDGEPVSRNSMLDLFAAAPLTATMIDKAIKAKFPLSGVRGAEREEQKEQRAYWKAKLIEDTGSTRFGVS